MELDVSNVNVNTVITSTPLNINGLYLDNDTTIGSNVQLASSLGSGLLGYQYNFGAALYGASWNDIFTYSLQPNNVSYFTDLDFRSFANGAPYSADSTYMFTGYFLAPVSGNWNFNVTGDGASVFNMWVGANAGLGVANSSNYFLDTSKSVTGANIYMNNQYQNNYFNINFTAGVYTPVRILLGTYVSSGFTLSFAPPNNIATSKFGTNLTGYFFNDAPYVRVGAGTYGQINSYSSTYNTSNASIITANSISVPTLTLGGLTWNGINFPGGMGGIVNTQYVTTTGNWINPLNDVTNPIQPLLTGNEQVLVMLWGAGGGASTNGGYINCGGGGAFAMGTYKLSDLPSAVYVTVGTGGADGGHGFGGDGGYSQFFGNGNILYAYGGGGGVEASTSGTSGAGGGLISAASTNTAGGPLGGAVATSGVNGGDSTFGGGGSAWANTNGNYGNAGSSVYGGGGGGQWLTNKSSYPGNSIYGGGGGSVNTVISTSIFGGAGGNNSFAPLTPGGGGGGIQKNGADGQVRIWVIR